MRSFFLLVMCSFIISCSDSSNLSNNDISIFFDLNAYFDKYIDAVPKEVSVKKIVGLGSDVEEQVFERYNIRKDLDYFRKADIYDPVFLDKYRIDTSVSGATKYIANDDDLAVLSLQVFKTDNKVDSILATTQINSMISDQLNHLLFIPFISYSIYTVEDAVFKDPVERSISVEFQ